MIGAVFGIGGFFKGLIRSVPWQIWAALAVAGLLGAAAWFIDDRAYTRGFSAADAQWQALVLEERARQAEANRLAQQAAAEEIARLTEARRVADAHIRRLIDEAQQDPDADTPALGPSSVRRLNQVN